MMTERRAEMESLTEKRFKCALCRRYHELFGAVDFNQLMELKERDTAQSPEEFQDAFGDTRLICPNCRNSVINYFNRSRPPQFCMICGQRLEWEEE